MRLKKSLINSTISMSTYLISFIPLFIVRKIFLEYMGGEVLGLISLYTNILGYLSIVEMGIGSAIIYSLYKPFYEKNYVKIKGYLECYKKFYIYAGAIVLIMGLALTPVIHHFVTDQMDIQLIRISFILMLINTVISYLFTYKHCLLIANQESYKVSIIICFSKVLISVLQIISIIKFKSLYIYLLIQIVVTLVSYLILNRHTKLKYKDIFLVEGQLEKQEKAELFKNVKALFFHKIGGIFVLGTDNIVISLFLNLKSVSIYNNYLLIVNAFNGLMGNVINSITPSVGNLLAEDNKEMAYDIFKKSFFVNFWISSFVVITLFNSFNHFIGIWVGEEYLLEGITVIFILLNLYFQLMRLSVEQFKSAGGEYHRDRYAPILEGVLNLVVSIFLVNKIGILGVVIGTFISNVLVVFWVKPKIVYSSIFKKPLIEYFKNYGYYMFIMSIPLAITYFLTYKLHDIYEFKYLLLNCIINFIVINSIYIIIFRKNIEFLYFKNLIFKLVKLKINNY